MVEYFILELEMIALASTWIFPKWEQAEEVLHEMIKSLGGYVGELSEGNFTVEIINPKLLMEVPPEYKDRFFKQYYWLRQHIVEKIGLSKLQEVYKNSNYDLDVAAKYVCDCIPDTTAVWFGIVMGMPIEVRIQVVTEDDLEEAIQQSIDDGTYDSFQDFMSSFMENEDDEV